MSTHLPGPDAPLGAAVIGAGFIAPVHVEALRRLGIPVRGILGSSADASRRAATSLGIERAYTNLEELLRDAAVQVIHIAAPNRLHRPFAQAALEAGKHVMCEKPLATTATDAQLLTDLAAARGLAAGLCHNVRFYPLAAEARALVADGAIGRVLSIFGSYTQDWLLLPEDYNWRVGADEAGGLRAVADIGTHWLDLAEHLVGDAIEAVAADLQVVHPTRQRPVAGSATFASSQSRAPGTEPISVVTEDAGGILLRFQGGARGVLWVSQAAAGRKNCLRFEIAGTLGSLAWNSERPDELWLGRRNSPNELRLRDPRQLSRAASPLTGLPAGHAEGFAETFKECFRAFYGAIADGRTMRPGRRDEPSRFATFADGHHELVLCEAIAQSHRERRWISVGGRS